MGGGAERRRRVSLDERVRAFHELVRTAISKADAKGMEFRLYDGAISLQWPALVHTHSSERDGRLSLRLSCSVLGGPSSHYSWSGRTWATVFEHAMHDVSVWIEDMDADAEDGGDDE